MANGLRDAEPRPAEEVVVVNALVDLEAPHIKVLMALRDKVAPTIVQFKSN